MYKEIVTIPRPCDYGGLMSDSSAPSDLSDKPRCPWSLGDPLMTAYHDTEWGVPVHDDRLLFEFLILEGAQAGLSWLTILKRRESYREAFAGFDPEAVARFGPRQVEALMANPGRHPQPAQDRGRGQKREGVPGRARGAWEHSPRIYGALSMDARS